MNEDQRNLLAEFGKDWLAEKIEAYIQDAMRRPLIQNPNPVYERKLLLGLIAEVAIDLQAKEYGT